MQRLREYGLLRWIDGLINKLGVECLNDLKYCSRQDFQSIGCKVVQIKKLEEIVNKYGNQNENEDGNENENDNQNNNNRGHIRRHTSFI